MKNEIFDEVRDQYQTDDTLVFHSEDFADGGNHEEVREAFEELGKDGKFYIETVLHCPEDHILVRMTKIPSRNQLSGMEYCDHCREHRSKRKANQTVKFILSSEAREDMED